MRPFGNGDSGNDDMEASSNNGGGKKRQQDGDEKDGKRPRLDEDKAMEQDQEEVKPPDHHDMTEENLDDFFWATFSPRDSPEFERYLELRSLKTAKQQFQADGSFAAREVQLSKQPPSLWSLAADNVRLHTYRARCLTNQQDFYNGVLRMNSDDFEPSMKWAESVRTQSEDDFYSRFRLFARSGNAEDLFEAFPPTVEEPWPEPNVPWN